MYLWGHNFGVVVPEEDVDPETPPGRTWNLAKRLMTDTFSNSWHSTLKSKIDVALSNLHCESECFKRNVTHLEGI